MKNKKQVLLEALAGSVEMLNSLSELSDGVDIYDETGHVDTEFLLQAIGSVNVFMDVSNKMVSKISSMLAPNVIESKKSEKVDDGSKWCVEDILKHCTLENNILKLPRIKFNKNSYAEAKKWIEEAGGSWRGGKVQGFVFPFNAERVFSILHDGKRCNLQQDFQFFETPPNVADWLVMMSGGISDEDSVLEPSAGRGGLIKSIHRSNPSVIVDCYELMPENKEFLQKMENVRILGDDFTKGEHSTYSKIIANPPFSHNQDIDHVRMMYEFLKEGGTLAAITSKHWEFSNEKKCEDFRAWISSVNGEVFNIPQGEFDCSGTPIETRAIIIRKNVL